MTSVDCTQANPNRKINQISQPRIQRRKYKPVIYTKKKMCLGFHRLQLDLNGAKASVTLKKPYFVPYLNFGRLSLEHSLTGFVFDIQRDFDRVIVFSYVSIGFFDHGTFVLEGCFFRIGILKPVSKRKKKMSTSVNFPRFMFLLPGN